MDLYITVNLASIKEGSQNEGHRGLLEFFLNQARDEL